MYTTSSPFLKNNITLTIEALPIFVINISEKHRYFMETSICRLVNEYIVRITTFVTILNGNKILLSTQFFYDLYESLLNDKINMQGQFVQMTTSKKKKNGLIHDFECTEYM